MVACKARRSLTRDSNDAKLGGKVEPDPLRLGKNAQLVAPIHGNRIGMAPVFSKAHRSNVLVERTERSTLDGVGSFF